MQKNVSLAKKNPGIKNKKQTSLIHKSIPNFLLTLILSVLFFACHKPVINPNDLRDFKQVNLVANTSEYHPVTVDPTLINAFHHTDRPTDNVPLY